jgi:sensor domain CHASE-containing protein
MKTSTYVSSVLQLLLIIVISIIVSIVMTAKWRNIQPLYYMPKL